METSSQLPQRGWRLGIKTLLDRSVALGGLIILFPILVGAALSVRLLMGKPTFFTQLRPGRNATPFILFKFRTMSDERDADGNKLPDDERLTCFGKFLRSTSLDELPQLWNVLRGDLSLVGPRPLLLKYLPRYSPEQARRHEVMPGITGWAQVNGRNTLTWDEKFKLDVWYVDNWSLLLDLKILWMTLIRVIRREGITQNGSATMTEFMEREG